MATIAMKCVPSSALVGLQINQCSCIRLDLAQQSATAINSEYLLRVARLKSRRS